MTWTGSQDHRARPGFRANGELRGKTGLQGSRGHPVKKGTRASVYLLPRCFQDLKAIAVWTAHPDFPGPGVHPGNGDSQGNPAPTDYPGRSAHQDYR